MAMNPEQLAAFLVSLQQAMVSTASVSTAEKAPPGMAAQFASGPKLLAKNMRVDVFAGVRERWDDWSFAFKRAVRSQNKHMYDLMSKWELEAEEISEETELSKEEEQRPAELYDLLCQFCFGVALTIIRSVDDMEEVRAWQVLFRK